MIGGPHWACGGSRALQVCFPDAEESHKLFLPIATQSLKEAESFLKDVRAASPDCVHTLALS